MPELVTPVTTPPEETFSTPPLDTATLWVTVPSTFTMPPLEIVKLCAVPPEDTFNTPPDETPAKLKSPPENTLTVPPEIPVPERLRQLLMPIGSMRYRKNFAT